MFLPERRPGIWLLGLLGTLAWGVFAFGANYHWAHPALLVGSVTFGGAGLALGKPRKMDGAFVFTLFMIGSAIAIQLIPLPRPVLTAVSPNAIRVLEVYDLQFAANGAGLHPISIEPQQTRLGFTLFVAFTILIIGTGKGLTRSGANDLAGGLVVLGATLAAVGIAQRTYFNGKIYGFWELVQGGLPFGPFINRNHFAGWMLMGVPVAFGYLLAQVSRGAHGRRKSIRELVVWLSTTEANRALLTAFAAITMSLSLVLTLSRSGIISFLLWLLLISGLAIRSHMGTSRRIATVACLILIGCGVIGWVGFDQISGRFGDATASTAGGRFAIWADTRRIIEDFWLTGTGLNTYGVSTLFYQTAQPGEHLREAHSDYLQIAAEGGLLLGIPIVIGIATFVVQVRRRLQQDVGSIRWIRLGAVTGLLSIAVQSLAEFSLQIPGNAAMFAVLAGIAIHDGRE